MQFFHVRVKKQYLEQSIEEPLWLFSLHRTSQGFLLRGASAHLLVMNLVDEKRAFHSLQTLRDLQRQSSGRNANISSLVSSGNSDQAAEAEHSSSTSAILAYPTLLGASPLSVNVLKSH
jgi:hypothetical protein